MQLQSTPQRIADLLLDPREDLQIELKNWLNLIDDKLAKATLAKAILALANHGGGFLILGYDECDTGAIVSPDRPATLDQYSQDVVNGVIQAYADPPFHCSVHVVAAPSGSLHPIVVVPGGHKIPVRAKRSGPHGQIIEQNAIYIRKAGPRSEVPTTAQDWDTLLARCLANRRDEMLDNIRVLLSGVAPSAAGNVEADRLNDWIESGLARWRTLSSGLPDGDPARCSHGFQIYAYRLDGSLKGLRGAQFADAVRSAEVNYSGWPPFWYPTRLGIAPYPIDNLVECWIGGDTENPKAHPAGQSDFWRISPDGFAFLLRGFHEDDGREVGGRQEAAPGTLFEITWPVDIVGEVLLHAASLTSKLIDGPAAITLAAHYHGLSGRRIVRLGGRPIFDRRTSRQDSIDLRSTFEVSAVDSNLPEIVGPFLAPLYALFDFFEMSPGTIAHQLTQLRQRRY